MLRDKEADVRAGAAEDLGFIGKPAANTIPAVINALEDPNKEVRDKAAEALGNIGENPQLVVPALIGAVK
jgi:HEAT repeat protein